MGPRAIDGHGRYRWIVVARLVGTQQLHASWGAELLPHRYQVASYTCVMMRVACDVLYLPAMIFTHADARFRSFSLTVSTESVCGSTPGVRVTWSTALPPECVTSVTVNFKQNYN